MLVAGEIKIESEVKSGLCRRVSSPLGDGVFIGGVFLISAPRACCN